jgi:hypothetical protein
MKQTLILLLFPLLLTAQVYNPDTTWTLTYAHVSKIRLEIEKSKAERELLTRELDLMYEKGNEQSKIIRKLQVRDSLYNKELEKAAEIENLFREKLILANEIMNNYKILVFSAETQLKAEEKKRKRAELWKNVYRYGWPAAGILALIILK